MNNWNSPKNVNSGETQKKPFSHRHRRRRWQLQLQQLSLLSSSSLVLAAVAAEVMVAGDNNGGWCGSGDAM